MSKRLRNILSVLFLILIVFLFKDEIKRGFLIAKKDFFPCREPVLYSLGVFDKRFGITEDEFMSAVKEAESIWEKPGGVNLFEEKDTGSLKINLAYDTRQEATKKLQEIDKLLESDRDKHESLKNQYDAAKVEYASLKKDFEARVAAFEVRKKAFDEKATYWNSRGGAPEGEYRVLERERIDLNAEAENLEFLQNNLNKKIDEINALAIALNEIARKLNKGVSRFNDIADDHGEEFEEGNYEYDALGERINIYQFEDRTSLVRVIAHELGHALGIAHVENPDSIMYRLNEGKNLETTEEDLVALKAQCRLK